jgi:hypothetical protein
VTLYDITVTEEDTIFTGSGTPPLPVYFSGGVELGGDAGIMDLPVGLDAIVFTATYVITQDDIDAGFVTNQALASGNNGPEGDPVTDRSDDDSILEDDPTEITLQQRPGIAVIKTGVLNDDDGTDGVSEGDTITYTYTVYNTGNVTLYDIAVTEEDTVFTGSGTPPLPVYFSGGVELGGNAGIRICRWGWTPSCSRRPTSSRRTISMRAL